MKFHIGSALKEGERLLEKFKPLECIRFRTGWVRIGIYSLGSLATRGVLEGILAYDQFVVLAARECLAREHRPSNTYGELGMHRFDIALELCIRGSRHA